MASVKDAGLSRITVVAPRTRIDLALPVDVPLADLLPTLLHYAGNDLAADTPAPQGWALSRLGGASLDSSRTPAQLEVRDGELLYLRPRGGEAPMLVFDDVVDAVATAANDRPGRWNSTMTRLFGLAFGVIALLAGSVVVLLTGPPQLPGGLIGLGMAVMLLLTAILLSRAAGDSVAGVAFAVTAMVYAAAGGLLVAAGDRGLGDLAGAHVLIAVTAVLLVTVVAAIGVADAAPIFLGTALVAVALDLTIVVYLGFGASIPAAAAIVGTVAFGLLPMLPMLAYRMAGLPVPAVPTEPGDLKRDVETVDGARVLQRSDRADGYLSGMLGAQATIGAAAAVAAAQSGWPGTIFSALIGLLLMARARLFRGRVQRLWLLCGGAAALAASTIEVFGMADQLLRLTAIVGGIVVVAAISAVYGLARPEGNKSPVWGRLLDIFEVLLILALVPLAIWTSGMYEWIRGIRG